MSTTCGVCNGAIPDGQTVDGHTALCAEFIRREAYEQGKADAWALCRERDTNLSRRVKELLEGPTGRGERAIDLLREWRSPPASIHEGNSTVPFVRWLTAIERKADALLAEPAREGAPDA